MISVVVLCIFKSITSICVPKSMRATAFLSSSFCICIYIYIINTEYIHISLSWASYVSFEKYLSFIRSKSQSVLSVFMGYYRIICKIYEMFCFCEHKPCQQRNRTVHSKSMRFAWAGVQHHNLNSRSYTQKPHIFNQIAFFEYYSLVRLSFHLARDLFSSSIVSVHNIHDHTYNNNDKKETNKQHNTRLKARINPRTKVLVMYPPKKKNWKEKPKLGWERDCV